MSAPGEHRITLPADLRIGAAAEAGFAGHVGPVEDIAGRVIEALRR